MKEPGTGIIRHQPCWHSKLLIWQQTPGISGATEVGCEPWKVERVFWNASSWWDKTLPDQVDNKTVFGVDVGGYDPILACHTENWQGKPAASIAVRVQRISLQRRTDRVPQALKENCSPVQIL